MAHPHLVVVVVAVVVVVVAVAAMVAMVAVVAVAAVAVAAATTAMDKAGWRGGGQIVNAIRTHLSSTHNRRLPPPSCPRSA